MVLAAVVAVRRVKAVLGEAGAARAPTLLATAPLRVRSPAGRGAPTGVGGVGVVVAEVVEELLVLVPPLPLLKLNLLDSSDRLHSSD